MWYEIVIKVGDHKMTDEKALEVLENTMIIYDNPKLDTDYTEFGEALENAIRALREKLYSRKKI